jgi:2-keto-4-pentenoate hydratase/2-oxohepta-3-ene-1,7-dioic acid hydratase in catechol pathway
MTNHHLCRFFEPTSEQTSFGLLENGGIYPLSIEEAYNLPRLTQPPELSGKPYGQDEVKLLAPVISSKIVCVGRNYKDHAAELGNPMPDEPLLFLKSPSAIIGHGEIIRLPGASSRVEHEGELGVVIGRRTHRLSDSENPLDYVLGYTCVNDVTARDLQRRDVQFTRAKSFDTFCPIGPFIVTGLDPFDLQVETRVNGQVRQSGRTAAMAFPVSYLIRYISHVMTLEPGDVISTGTPAGVGPLLEGDVCEVEVEKVGTLSNPVQASV